MADLPFSQRQPRPFCSLIIPAYDEEARVGGVAQLCVRSGLFAEVVVVDDGSNDNTADAARVTGARVVQHGRNKGKPAAMLTGLKNTTCPVVCFLDADLLHVTTEHLVALVDPVLDGEVAATLGVFRGGRAATSLAQRIAPMISGQRCLKRELLDSFTDWHSGFGVETALNDYLRRIGVEQRIIEWYGAAQVMKEEKRGFIRGFVSRLIMYSDIAVTWLKTKLRRSRPS